MRFLHRVASLIDVLNEGVGRSVRWLVVIAVIVSSGNALARYALGLSSNAFLEIQWYLFAAVFLLAAGYTHKHDGHVRVDIFYSRWSARTRTWVDIFGGLFFLLPMSLTILWLSWPVFEASFAINEGSPDPGGLLRWPIKLAIPLGFALLSLQAVSEVIKRLCSLRSTASHTEDRRR